MKGSIRFFMFGLLCSLLAHVGELVCPKIISYTIDTLLAGKESDLPEFVLRFTNQLLDGKTVTAQLVYIGFTIVIIALFMSVFKYLDTVFNRKGSETLVENMRLKLYGHIERLPFSWFMKNQTGDIIQRCTSDVDMVKEFLSEQLTSVINTVILIVMSLVFMYSVNAQLATVALLMIPVIIAYNIIFHGKIGSGFRTCDEQEGKLSSIVQENLTGVRVVRAFGREKYEVDKFTKQNDIYANSWIKLGLYISLFWCTGDVISGLQVFFILVASTVLCVRGNMTVGELVAMVSYNSMLMWPVRQLGRVISEMSKAGISISRIAEIMNAEIEKDEPDSVDADMSGDIVFDDVSFRYDESAEILKNINLTIPKGSTLGIIGMTGSGKTTLVSLLCRLYDLPADSGRITVSGRDINRIKRESLRKNIGIVLQEPFLFSRTLKENIGIAFDNPSSHDYEIKEAVKAASLEDTINNFTAGYDTMVGERGVTLSGGQKQRTAIARLLTSAPPVMIFDDSLSAVDSETDAKIRKALREKTADSTVIIISHRIQTLMNSDNIIVLSDGEIVESGSHRELLEKDGIYRRIYDIQTGGVEDGRE